jgi:hypothetical protein
MPREDANADAQIVALRAEVIGNRQPITVIAKLNDQTVRAVYGNIQRLGIPFIRVGDERFLYPAVYAEMRGRSESAPPAPAPPPAPPRRPGRPRKAAAAPRRRQLQEDKGQM